MKKFVLTSLLVLTFPIAAFAETSESVPNTTESRQEQTVESIPAPAAEKIIDSDLTTNSTVPSVEEVADEKAKTTNSSVADLEQKEAAKTKDSTTQSSGTKESDEPVKEETKVSETPAPVKKEETKEYTPAVIRDLLTKDNYGIDQTELTGYTDDQLANTFKLFERYNYDVIGMDMGSYVRVLRMVYKDNVISWTDAEKALAFNPSQYQTTEDLIKNVDQLYNYIQVLYPKGNGFAELSHYSKEELLYILNHLTPAQKDLIARHGSLFSGVVNWIQASSIGNAPIDNGPRKNDKVTNVATNNNQTTEAPKKAEQKVEQQAAVQKQYPKTGEQRTIYLTIVGMVVVVATGLIAWRNKRTSH